MDIKYTKNKIVSVKNQRGISKLGSNGIMEVRCKIQNLRNIRLLTMMGIAVIALFIITLFPTQNKQVEKEDFVLDTEYCVAQPSMYVAAYIETPDKEYQDIEEIVEDTDENAEEEESTFTRL